MIVSGLVACLLLELVHLDLVHGGEGKQNQQQQHHHHQHHHQQLYEQYDTLFVARCEARCWNYKNRNKCTKSCLSKDAKKPGQCPASNSPASSPFAAVCRNTCDQDSECPGLTKCCSHSCGVTCQLPKDLELEEDIPEVPTDLTVTERRRKRTLQLKWIPGDSPGGITVFIVEERHYSGQHFIEQRMTEWAPCMRTLKSNVVLKRVAKPGRWYQFRVAAVNENGTKGYSDNSARFITSAGPRPPKLPQNVTVGPLLRSNGSLSTELRWRPPNSDLPVDRYKVFWSRRLHGAAALDSVLVHQQVVPKDHTRFLIQNLQPNSLYFLQVQALAQFGKDRLKSEKSGLILNTTNYTNVTEGSEGNPVGKVDGLHLQKVFWYQGELRARIAWKYRKGAKRYTVTWRNNGSCQDNLNFTLATTTKASQFDLYDLEFKCRYRISVRETTSESLKTMEESSIGLTVPPCEDFRLKYPEIVCSD